VSVVAGQNRQKKGPDGKVLFEPCSPSEPGAVETTLTELAEKGLAPQVGSLHIHCPSDFCCHRIIPLKSLVLLTNAP
jgi:hypothetical protein